MARLRIGTRGSPLALAQARLVADALRVAHGWDASRIEIVPIVTTGDVVKDRPLAEIGGKALWTKELDEHLLSRRTDLSVHSMKDVETLRPDTLRIAATLPRADVRDRLIGAASINALPQGARLGTSSPRRAAQLLCRRPDLRILPFRGNVETRLRKLAAGEADATLLAAAGLDRLGRHDVGVALDDFLPAPAQGTVGIEVREDDKATARIVQAIDHAETHACILAERAFLAGLGGDCHSPISALAVMEGGQIHLRGQIMAQNGGELRRGEARFAPGDEAAPKALARSLLEQASPKLRSLFLA